MKVGLARTAELIEQLQAEVAEFQRMAREQGRAVDILDGRHERVYYAGRASELDPIDLDATFVKIRTPPDFVDNIYS